MENTKEKKEFKLRNSFGDYFKLGAVGQYFVRLFGKRDPNQPRNTNLILMHGINKISVIVFLFALIVLIIRRLF